MKRSVLAGPALGLAFAATALARPVFPTTPHAAFNFIPFGSGGAGLVSTQHQVFASTLFSGVTGGLPIAFAPNNGLAGTMQDLGSTVIRFGYTNATPGAAAGAGGLDAPAVGGGGAPNAVGALSDFYVNPAHIVNVVAGGTNNFEMIIDGTPFVYNPAQGNLLIEIVSTNLNITHSVSRSGGSAESSRAYSGGRFGTAPSPTTATRIDFTFEAVQGCYPDCDGNQQLNVNDYICFQTKFALGDPYADCDGNGQRNVNDYICFQTKFALGC